MKAIEKILRIGALVLMLAFTSCDKFPLQSNEEFRPSSINPVLNQTAWEYINSNLSEFSSMKNAIEVAGLVNDYKSGSNKTFLLLNNTAMNTYFAANKVSNPNYDGTSTNGPEYITPLDFTMYPKERVIEFLEYHILDQKLAITNAQGFDEQDVSANTDGAFEQSSWYKTRAYKKFGDTALISAWWAKDRNCSFYFNNFVGHYKKGTKPAISNMVAKNGVVHVFSRFLEQPSDEDLEYYGISY